jgi:hypothetical protein
MPLPDPNADETTVEISHGLRVRHNYCVEQVKYWQKLADEAKGEILAAMGDAFAATIDGEKVYTHRPKSNYADARLRKDYPEMTQHYVRTKEVEVFDVTMFAKVHPEIAEQYRVRSFNVVEK